jgi:hypothetical protein
VSPGFSICSGYQATKEIGLLFASFPRRRRFRGSGCRGKVGVPDRISHLPEHGWGRLTLEKSRPEVNRRWADTATAHEERGLEHRPATETRSVPVPPELVAILRHHVATFGTASDGRVFSSTRGHVVASTAISDVWAEARTRALTPAQVASPLAGRPYDLRHAAVSLWLNAGVSPQDVAHRAGHSAEVLLRVYAKCLDGGETVANKPDRGGAQRCVTPILDAPDGTRSALPGAWTWARSTSRHPVYIPRHPASGCVSWRLAACPSRESRAPRRP